MLMDEEEIYKVITKVMGYIADIDFYDWSAKAKRSNQQKINKAYFELDEIKKYIKERNNLK